MSRRYLLELLHYMCVKRVESRVVDRRSANDGQELPMIFNNNQMMFCEATPGHPILDLCWPLNPCPADCLDWLLCSRRVQFNFKKMI